MNDLARRLAAIIQEMRTSVATFHYERGSAGEPEFITIPPGGPVSR